MQPAADRRKARRHDDTSRVTWHRLRARRRPSCSPARRAPTSRPRSRRTSTPASCRRWRNGFRACRSSSTSSRADWTPGRYGGEARTLMAKDRDIRMMVVYGYSRLVGYDEKLQLVPDILESVDNVDSRVFTFHLRPGHKWSDGQPFTAADFRYYWEDVATNKDLSPFGLPQALLVRGSGPRFEVLNETTVRFTWDEPNPQFLPALAGPSPLYIYRPAHYLRQFHPRYVGLEKANAEAQGGRFPQLGGVPPEEGRAVPLRQSRPADARAVGQHDARCRRRGSCSCAIPTSTASTGRPAASLHRPRDRQHHRRQADPGQDRRRRQRPAGALPAVRQLHVPQAERAAQPVSRPALGKAIGSQIALFPNLNAEDPVWRALMRDVRFRRALSLAINRHEINEVVYFGLAKESSNTVLQRSSAVPAGIPQRLDQVRLEGGQRAAGRDRAHPARRARPPPAARRPPDGDRRRHGGREHRGDRRARARPRQLAEGGHRHVFPPSQREVFRKRVFSGKSIMTIWSGLNNGIPTPDMSPHELAPTAQDQLQWPMWGQYYENNRKGGEPPALPEAQELVRLYETWRNAASTEERERTGCGCSRSMPSRSSRSASSPTHCSRSSSRRLRNVPTRASTAGIRLVLRHVPPGYLLVRAKERR